MKPSELPFGGYDNEKLRILMAEAISRAEISVANNGGESTEHAAKLKALFDAAYLYLDVVSPGRPGPEGIDDSTIVITPSATSFEAAWELPVQDPEAYPLNGWKLNIRLGSPSGTLVHTITTGDDSDAYTYAGPALTPSTAYFFSIQGTYTAQNGEEYGTGLAGKSFTTAAA